MAANPVAGKPTPNGRAKRHPPRAEALKRRINVGDFIPQPEAKTDPADLVQAVLSGASKAWDWACQQWKDFRETQRRSLRNTKTVAETGTNLDDASIGQLAKQLAAEILTLLWTLIRQAATTTHRLIRARLNRGKS